MDCPVIMQTAWCYLKDTLAGGVWKGALAVCWALTVEFVGGADQTFRALFFLYILDFIFGIIVTCYRGEDFSVVRFKCGLLKFILYGVGVGVGQFLDNLVTGPGFVFGLSIRDGIAIFLGIHEGVSILTHLEALGLPIPPGLLQRLRGYRDGVFKNQEKRGSCE